MVHISSIAVGFVALCSLVSADIVRIPTKLSYRTASAPNLGASVKLAVAADEGLKYSGALVGTVSLGTPAQTFGVILDTGSQTFWVRGYNCVRSASCLATDTGFNPTKSTTYVAGSAVSFELGPYGDGLDAFGLGGIDTMVMAGISVAKSPFYYATNITVGSSSLGADGIMGIPAANLANSSFDQQYVPGTLAAAGALTSNIWGFWYNNSQTTVGTNYLDGQLSLGGIDTALYTGSISWAPLLWQPSTLPAALISLSAYWFVSLTSITVGSSGNVLSTTTAPAYAGQKSSSGFAINGAGEIPFLVDTGTTLTILPTGVVAAIASALKAKTYAGAGTTGVYGPNCNSLAFTSYPNITFTLGGQTLTVPPTGYTIPDSNNNYCNGFFIFQGSASAPLNGGILGNLQQSNYYNLFDWSGRQIGFATPSVTGAGSGTSFSNSTTSPGTGSGTGTGTTTGSTKSSAPVRKSSGTVMAALALAAVSVLFL
ncbi:hypothetical protein SmJEL517_g06085 [Synchytrium microbalum]|uniref:Peptidase A1 domain-containing protein n=1 Tax=Synchytrium microbalum TaxID=1806994 RepID=A0A507BT97_9FUNG|nr:uncharacterized protein SmJEL517_g06085 [Synchytrium microbalum]TPX30329.1 hypothetical protein SmJEL517_g06085 [Synchytrium microbalum]